MLPRAPRPRLGEAARAAASAGAQPVPTAVPLSVIARYQFPTHGLGFGHDLSTYGRVPSGGPFGYFGGIYRSPFIDVLTADLALAFLNDPSYALGRGDVAGPPRDLLLGPRSRRARLRRRERGVARHAPPPRPPDRARPRRARRGRFPKGTVLLALSADHGFPTMPEVAKALDKTAKGGRLETGRDTLEQRARPPEPLPRRRALPRPLREDRRRDGRLEPLLQPRVVPVQDGRGSVRPRRARRHAPPTSTASSRRSSGRSGTRRSRTSSPSPRRPPGPTRRRVRVRAQRLRPRALRATRS